MGWTDDDYRRMGMTPPGKGKVTAPAPQKPKPVLGNTQLHRDALARRLREAGAE